MYVCFIDFTKAYDFVDRTALCYKLLRSGVIGRVYEVIHDMYSAVRSIVREGFETSKVIEQIAGVRQGCVLSPCLFSIYIADLPQVLQEAGTTGVRLHDVWVRILLYADDGALVAHSAEDLQAMLNALRSYCAKWRLIVNVSKTKCMVWSTAQVSAEVFTYGGEMIEVVKEFKYLGLMFDSNGGSRSAPHTVIMKNRLQQAKRLIAAWKRRCVM